MLELSKGIGIRNREYIQWCSSDGGPRSSAMQKPLSSIVGNCMVGAPWQGYIIRSGFVVQYVLLLLRISPGMIVALTKVLLGLFVCLFEL